jgi:hypothetical protein
VERATWERAKREKAEEVQRATWERAKRESSGRVAEEGYWSPVGLMSKFFRYSTARLPTLKRRCDRRLAIGINGRLRSPQRPHTRCGGRTRTGATKMRLGKTNAWRAHRPRIAPRRSSTSVRRCRASAGPAVVAAAGASRSAARLAAKCAYAVNVQP